MVAKLIFVGRAPRDPLGVAKLVVEAPSIRSSAIRAVTDLATLAEEGPASRRRIFPDVAVRDRAFSLPNRRARRSAPAMRRHVRLHQAIGAVATLLACRGSDAPTAPLASVPVTLCVAGWLAYQNDGAPWVRATSQGGRYSFAATDRLAIAWQTVAAGASSYLSVEYLTADQAVATYGCRSSLTPAGVASVVVRGFSLPMFAEVRYGVGGMSTYTPDTPFNLYVYQAATDDLVATRVEPPGIATRAIIRRAPSYANGASVSVDFASAEAFALAEHALRWTGPEAHVQVNFRTATGPGSEPSGNVLQSIVSGPSGSGDGARRTTLYSIPSSHTAPGDLHYLRLGGNERSVELVYREARDRDLIFGPPANTPSFTTVATSPNRRIRATVTAQPEYDRRVSVLFVQRATGMANGHIIQMAATKEYLRGTPQIWSLTMPDLSIVDGFDRNAYPTAGDYEWVLSASSQPLDFKVETAREEQIFRSATRNGVAP